MDGGIAFPFGYDRALELGYKKIIIVMTRERGFIKKQMPSLLLKGYDRYFKPLPQFLKACKTRAERYNKLMEIVDKAEDEGKILTIRPEHAVDIARIEQDENKLEALYEHGIEVAKANLERVKKYLDIV